VITWSVENKNWRESRKTKVKTENTKYWFLIRLISLSKPFFFFLTYLTRPFTKHARLDFVCLRGCYSLKEDKPIISQSGAVGRSFVLEPCKFFVQAFLSFYERGQWSYFLTQRWSTKINHWNSSFHAVGQNPVPDTLKPPISHNLQSHPPNQDLLH